MNKAIKKPEPNIPRRDFLRSGSAAAIAGALVSGCAHSPPPKQKPPVTKPEEGASPASQPARSEEEQKPNIEEQQKPMVKVYNTLGRTGFKVSDISLGCGHISDVNLLRYAFDRGINYFDTAEGYSNGDSERMIGKAMPNLQREKIFITTKLVLKENESEKSIVDRFNRCLERMKTNYADALFMHSVTDVKMIKHAGFHAAIKRLKADGKVKHAGISSHGPRGKGKYSMEKVLLAAIQDGRFDLMLLVLNFMNNEPGKKVIATCKGKNIGTLLMKTAPAQLNWTPFDPENPTGFYAKILARLLKTGIKREVAIKKIQTYSTWYDSKMKKSKAAVDAFIKKYGVKTQKDMQRLGAMWALQHSSPDSVCLSMPDFEGIDAMMPISGTKLTAAEETLLRDYALIYGSQYCRHGCNDCADACPHDVPVSTIMRYAYYFKGQGREKFSMQKYAALDTSNASQCIVCPGHCRSACPHGVAVQAQLLTAHHQLTLG